jgi:hypothetical protein
VDTQTKIEKLKEAQLEISAEEYWTTDWYAKDVYGQHVEPNDSCAKRWCATGAIFLITESDDEENEENWILTNELDITADKLYNMPASVVNDMHGFDAVHEIYEETIKRLQKELE